MSIVYPSSRQEIVDRIATDIQNELPELNPFLRESLIRAIAIGMAGRFFDLYKQQQQAQNELFIDTATDDDFIRRLGLFKGIDLNPASIAKGFITVTGTDGTLVPQGTLYETEDTTEYEVIEQDYEIKDTDLVIQTLTRSGQTATAVLQVDHNLATGTSVVISGANETDYNGTFTITATSEKVFTYTVSGTPATPATGDILATATFASVEIESSETGLDKNLESGAKVSLKNPIAGVDTDAYVQFDKITGGTDQEDIESYRERSEDAYANPISNSNDSDIIRVAQSIPGVTRVWVFDATPEPGDFEVYFTRDNDPDIIPDPQEVDRVKAAILAIKPAPMRDEDVHVYAPEKKIVDFIFNSLDPDSVAMRQAISDRLEQFFKEIPDVGEDLSRDSYRSIIYQTLDPETGDFIRSFELATPTGDIVALTGQLAVLGNITFPS